MNYPLSRAWPGNAEVAASVAKSVTETVAQTVAEVEALPAVQTRASPAQAQHPQAGHDVSVLTLPNRHALTTSIRARAQVFVDPRSLELLERIQRVAPSDANILIVGETGTGKELVARHVHSLSRRRDGPFVAVNCGAFSETLVESELFGHEKGAFTGALSARPGWFETANGGTLFLDEIGDLPLSMQVKLLRVLQEREVVRLGSRRGVPIDVRVLAATNVHLHRAVAAGHFRSDLFYRLNVVQLAIPALRERPGDILPLAHYFIEDYRGRLGYGPCAISSDAEQKLLTHGWPGNIRELENAIHHALLVSRHDALQDTDLHLFSSGIPAISAISAGFADMRAHGAEMARETLGVLDIAGIPKNAGNIPDTVNTTNTASRALEAALRELFNNHNDEQEPLFEQIEDAVMRTAFEYSRRNQVQAARLLGISRNVLRARLIRAREISALK